MSKGLEALKEIKEHIHYDCFLEKDWDRLDLIERELKALEIIKNKQIDIWQLRLCMSFNLTTTKEEQLNEYNKRHATFLHLTQEEYDLLKEVLL